MKTPASLLAALIWMISVSACTSASESSSSPVVFSDSAGVRIVHSHAPRWGEGEGWSVSSEPQRTIGTLNGSEEYQLVAVSSAARQSDGDLLVVDAGARTVRLYDREGIFLKILGGPGSGPGEFQDPGRVMVTGGDTVVVWDNRLFRITRFDPQGELVDVQTVDLAAIARAVEPPLYPGELDPLADGQILVRLIEKVKGFPQGRSRQRSGALRVSGDLSVIDTLMFFGDIEQVSVDAPFGAWPLPLPHGKRTEITHQGNPSRICIGDQEAPQIACFGPDRSRTVLRWTSEPIPLSPEEVALWRETTLRLFEQKLTEIEILQMLDQVSVPEVRPHYSRITLDRVGYLWVELGPSPRVSPPSVDYLVFDTVGALLGVVALPPIEVLEIGEDYLLGIHHDEFEVEYLQVYEIAR